MGEVCVSDFLLTMLGPESQLTPILPPREAVAREGEETTVMKVGSILPRGICGSVGDSECESLCPWHCYL